MRSPRPGWRIPGMELLKHTATRRCPPIPGAGMAGPITRPFAPTTGGIALADVSGPNCNPPRVD